jgi:hypothetical protein
MNVDEARAAISTKVDKDPSVSSLHSTVSRLRAALPEGMLPDATASGAYRLAGDDVEVDWATFSTLAANAEAVDGPDRAELRAAALGLVRGPALAHGGWEGMDAMLRHIDAVVEHTALVAAVDAMAADDPHRAEAAVAAGLAAVAGSPRLWEQRLRAAADGSGYGLARAWADAQARLRDDAAAVEPLYRQLADRHPSDRYPSDRHPS